MIVLLILSSWPWIEVLMDTSLQLPLFKCLYVDCACISNLLFAFLIILGHSHCSYRSLKKKMEVLIEFVQMSGEMQRHDAHSPAVLTPSSSLSNGVQMFLSILSGVQR